MGIEVDGEAAQEASEATDAATKLLDQLLPAVLKAFRTAREEVALPLVPFLTAYVARLKMLHKRYVHSSCEPQPLTESRYSNMPFPKD